MLLVIFKWNLTRLCWNVILHLRTRNSNSTCVAKAFMSFLFSFQMYLSLTVIKNARLWIKYFNCWLQTKMNLTIMSKKGKEYIYLFMAHLLACLKSFINNNNNKKNFLHREDTKGFIHQSHDISTLSVWLSSSVHTQCPLKASKPQKHQGTFDHVI